MEWMARVNWADVLAVIIILRSTYVGSQRGFFGELFCILGIWLIIIFSIHLYVPVSNFINTYLFIALNISNLIGFLIITLALYFGFRFIHNLLQKTIKIEVFPAINKIGGSLLGFCKGFIIATLLFLIMLLIPISYITNSAKARSLFGPFFVKTGAALYEKSLSIISAVEGESLDRLLAGAKPLEFRIFRFKRKDKLDEILQ